MPWLKRAGIWRLGSSEDQALEKTETYAASAWIHVDELQMKTHEVEAQDIFYPPHHVAISTEAHSSTELPILAY